MADEGLDLSRVDFRRHPELYRVGRGEQGVLSVEPSKSELLPHWRFRTVAIAERSAATPTAMFLAYLEANDFAGADIARKFLPMGQARSRRYANPKGGGSTTPLPAKYGPRTGTPRRPPRRCSMRPTRPPGRTPSIVPSKPTTGGVSAGERKDAAGL